MKAALFIPCYVDAVFPEVGIATLELLERFGVEVDYPLNQTCCGQPMANSGCQDDAADARYGVFMTGPSATADIEGVLIHGAQGIRSLTVVLMPQRA